MGKKVFLNFRLIAKCASIPFIIGGVLLFVIQFLPTYIGKGVWFYIFIAGAILWTLDTLWDYINDLGVIVSEIKKHSK